MGCKYVDTPCSSADRTSAWVFIGRSTLLVSPTSAQYPRSADMATTGECVVVNRSEEHTSELQSLMRISYAVFCLKKKKKINTTIILHRINKKHIRKTQR